ncbi:hypothetical protein COOONC_06495 [Cooperia oncophora]
MTYEHTPAEGPPVAALMDFVCDKILGKEFNDDSSVPEGRVKRLDFELNDAQIDQIRKSCKKMDKAVDDLDVAVHSFKRYGKNYPKSVNISPDSFIQMAFQLAFFRIHSALPPTYETATLRKFEEGRTENIRSPNALAEAFVRKMASGREPVDVVYDALKAAADSHKKYTVGDLQYELHEWSGNGSASSGLETTSCRKMACQCQAFLIHLPTNICATFKFLLARSPRKTTSNCALVHRRLTATESAIIHRKLKYISPSQVSEAFSRQAPNDSLKNWIEHSTT